jgi:Domain of unknown function (DUF4166)
MKVKALKWQDTAEALPRELQDLRFRQLLGREGWASLPEAVRRRFGKRLGAGQSANYAGEVLTCRMNASGWLLAQLCRVIGAPLPLERDGGVAAVVSVTEHGASGGQVWTRVYARRRGFPQVIHSAKRFAGPTGLEEYLGGGIGIALTVSALDSGIRFASDHYFLQLGRWRLRWPRWIAPGLLTIDHVDCGEGAFTFTLALNHPLLGEVMHQHSRFSDQAAQQGILYHD